MGEAFPCVQSWRQCVDRRHGWRKANDGSDKALVSNIEWSDYSRWKYQVRLQSASPSDGSKDLYGADYGSTPRWHLGCPSIRRLQSLYGSEREMAGTRSTDGRCDRKRDEEDSSATW